MATGVYQIRNIVNEKCYIGSAAGKNGFDGRWGIHLHYLRHSTHANSYLQNAWNKHGEDAFVFEIIEECVSDQCLMREQHYLDAQQPEYNINPTVSSRLGAKLSDESKAKISKAHMGKKVSIEEAQRLRTLACGAKRSAQHREAISQAQKGKSKSDEHRAKLSQAMIGNPNRVGTKHSAQSKIKIGAAHKGKVVSQETRIKISLAMSKRVGSQTPSAKLDENKVRSILQMLNNGVKQKDIANQFNVSVNTISRIKLGLAWKHVTGGV